MKPIKVGLVGCGHNADNHLRVYSQIDGANVEAVCDRNLAKAKEKANKYGIKQVLNEYKSLLKLNLDLIDIVTQTPTHAQLSRLALEAGSNVLVEKPMAVTSKDCKTMINAAKKKGRTLCVVHNKLFFDSIMNTKTVLNDEELVVSRFRTSHYFTHAYPGWLESWRLTDKSGGILWDALVHLCYLTEYFLGPIQSVYAVANKVKEDVFDSFTLILKNKRSMGVCEFFWDTKETLNEIHLITEEGDRFHVDLMNDVVVRRSRPYRNRGVSALRSFSDDLYIPLMKWTGHIRNFLEIRSYPGALPFEKTFFTLIRQLVSFLAGSTSSPPVTPEEGLRAVKILESAKRSITTGRIQYPQ